MTFFKIINTAFLFSSLIHAKLIVDRALDSSSNSKEDKNSRFIKLIYHLDNFMLTNKPLHILV